MNKTQDALSAQQAAVIMILSRAFSEAASIASVGKHEITFGMTYGMQRFTVIAASFLLAAAASVPVYIISKKYPDESFISLLYEKNKILARTAAVLTVPLMLFFMTDTAIRLYCYTSSTVFDTAVPFVFYFFVGAICLYAMAKGPGTSARAGFLAAAGLAALFIMLFFGLGGEIKLNRLYPAFTDRPESFMREVTAEFSLNYEIILFSVLSPSVRKNAHRCIPVYLGVSCAVLLIMTFLCNTVFGELLQYLDFPFYSLSSLADIGVIHRLNGIDVMLWTAAAAVKISLSAFIVRSAVKQAFKGKKTAVISSPVSLVLSLFLSWLLVDKPAFFGFLTALRTTGIPLTLAAAVIPAVSLFYAGRRRMIDN